MKKALKRFLEKALLIIAAPFLAIGAAVTEVVRIPGVKGVGVIVTGVLLMLAAVVTYGVYGWLEAAKKTEQAKTLSIEEGVTDVDGPSPDARGLGFASSLLGGALNAITGATLDVNSEIYYDDDTVIDGETQMNALPSSLTTTAPNSARGYQMVWNDGDQGTDRGTEIYGRRIPMQYTNRAVYTIPDTDGGSFIKMYAEATSLTWYGFENNDLETVLNVSVGSGSRVTSLKLKMEVGSNTAFGNPDPAATAVADTLKNGAKASPDYPVGVCFNTSGSGAGSEIGDWEEVIPKSYIAKFDPCQANKSSKMLGDCFVLDTKALIDGVRGFSSTVEFEIIIDAESGINPATSTASLHAFPMDATYYKDDAGTWRYGFCDNSLEGTDYDPGFSAYTSGIRIVLE